MNAAEAARRFGSGRDIYLSGGSVELAADHADVSARQMRKHLIAAGVYDPERGRRAERALAQRAIEMRARHMTFDDIAAELGYASRSGAYMAASRELRRQKREADESSPEAG